LAFEQAEQIVLIGDQKQLGPMVDYNITGPKSLHQRLILAGHPSYLLNI
jgi:hypothetical protein